MTATSKQPAPASAAARRPKLTHNTQTCLQQFAEGRHAELAGHFIEVLEFLRKQAYAELDVDTRLFVTTFVKDFLFLFTDPKFTLTGAQARHFVTLNPVISNLVAMTGMRTTDLYLELLLDPRHKNNLAKILALYSARNTVHIDIGRLLDVNPTLAGLWYSLYFGLYTSVLASRTGLANFRRHLLYDDPRLERFYNFHDIYFSVTYADPVNDRLLKGRINAALQRQLAGVTIRNTPGRSADGRPKLAVFSDLWHERHSVYRNQAEFIATLQEDYHLSFFHMEFPDRERFDTRVFDEVHFLGDGKGGLKLDRLLDNDFTIAYFPDVGMTMKSIMCANLRIAPIQVCGVGHSVSTFGSLIDYYISGADVELEHGAEENYSERLVLLPGYGIIHNPIHYARRNPPVSDDPLVINCPWYSQKTNHEMLELLARIDRETGRRLHFRFYPGGSVGRDNGHVAFARDVGRVLAPGTFTVYPGMPYDDYMARMEEGALTIDAFPFGGCNTVADSLYLGKVTLTYQGRSWYNRIGSQMLLSVGLDELVARDDEGYVARAVRLVDDDAYRGELEARMQRLPIMQTIFDNESQKHFKAAIDYLVANHAALAAEGSRAPIRIA